MTEPHLPASHPKKPKRRRRWVRRLGIGFVVFVLLIGGLYVFRQELFGRMLADKVGQALSESLGVPVHVDRVIGSWVADARVEGVTVQTGPRSGALVDFSAKSLVVRFSLWRILQGDIVKGIEGVEAEELRIVLDPSKAPPAPPDDKETSVGEIIESVPANFPLLKIDADVEVRTEMGVFRIAGMSITCPGGPVISLDAEQILLPEPAGDVGALHARLRRDERGLTWETKSTIAGIELTEVDADEQGNVRVKATVADAPLNLSWGGGKASVKTGPMQVTAVPPWILRLIPAENARPSSGSMAFSIDATQLEPLVATATLTGRDLVLPEDRIESIDIAARAEDGLFHLDSATARASSATLDAEGIVLDPARPLGLSTLKKLSLQAKDLRRFVETLDRPVRADIQIYSEDGSRATIEKLSLTGDGVNLEADGFVELANAADTPASDPLIKNMNLIWKGRAVDIDVGPVKIRGHLAGSGKAHGTLAHPNVEVDLEGADLLVKDVVLAKVAGRATLVDDLATFESLTAQGPGLTLSAKGQVDLGKEQLRDVTFQVKVDELSAFHDVYERLGVPVLAGTCALNGQLDGSFATPAGVFHLDAQRVRVDTFDLGALVLDMTSDGDQVQISRADVNGPWGAVALTAEVAPGKQLATIKTLAGTYDKYKAALKQPATVQWADGVRLRDLDLAVLGGQLTGQVDVAPRLLADVAFSGIDLSALRDDIQGTAQGRIALDGESGLVDLSVPDLRAQGHAGSLRIVAKQGPSGIVVETLHIVAGDDLRVTGAGTLPWQVTEGGLRALAITGATFDASIAVANLRKWVEAAPVGEVKADLALRGHSVTAHGFVRSIEMDGLAPLAKVSFDVATGPDTTQVKVAVEDDARLAAELNASIQAGWRWDQPAELPTEVDALSANGTLSIRTLDLSVLRTWLPAETVSDLTGTAQADVTFSGTANDPTIQGTLRLGETRAVLPDVPQPILVRDLTIEINETQVALRNGTISYATATVTPTGTLRLPPTLQGDWMAQPLDARIGLDVPDVSVFGTFVPDVSALRGSLKGTLTATGTPSQPKMGGQVVGASLAATIGSPLIEGAPLDVQIPTLRVALVGDRVELEEATITADTVSASLQGSFTLPSSDIDFESSPLSLTVRAKLADLSLVRRFVPDMPDVQGRVETDMTVSGTAAQPFVVGWIEALDIRYPLPEQQVVALLPRLRIAASRERVTIEQAEAQVRDVRVRVTGGISVPPGGVRGDWLVQPLDVTVALDVPTLDVLDLVNRDLARLRGAIRGSIHATGTASSPVLAGDVDLVDISGRLPGGLSRIDSLSGRIHLQDRAVTLQNLRGTLGRAPFTIEGGVRWPEGSELAMQVRLRGTNLQLMRSNELRVRANVDLEVAGPLSGLAARGQVTVVDVVYAVRMDALGGGGGPATAGSGDRIELFSIEDGPLSKMTFDIGLRADRTIRIRTNMIRGNVSADMRLLGTGVAPVLDGAASFPGLLLQFPFSSLKVDAGEASFERTRPGQPRIQAEARTTMRGYELTVQVKGVYPDVELNVSSNPPLSQQDAFLLLTTGATTEQLQEEGLARAALTRIATVFGKRLFASDVGPEDPDDKSLFDRIEFVQGRRISRSGQETIEAEVELSEKWYLRFERDRYDDFNAGVVWRWKFR